MSEVYQVEITFTGRIIMDVLAGNPYHAEAEVRRQIEQYPGRFVAGDVQIQSTQVEARRTSYPCPCCGGNGISPYDNSGEPCPACDGHGEDQFPYLNKGSGHER